MSLSKKIALDKLYDLSRFLDKGYKISDNDIGFITTVFRDIGYEFDSLTDYEKKMYFNFVLAFVNQN